MAELTPLTDKLETREVAQKNSAIRRASQDGACLRCGGAYDKKKMLCPKCGTPNFVERPIWATTVNVALFVAFEIFAGFFIV